MALSKILPAGQDQFAGARNLIINGAMQVAQRGTSFTSNNSVDYTLDRWGVFANGQITTTQQTFTVGQTSVPNEPTNYVRWNVTSYSSGDNLYQKVEDVRTLAGQYATLSFYAKSDTNITTRPRFIQDFGSGGSSDVITTTDTADITTSWQKFVITTAIPSISGKTIGASNYLEIEILRVTDTFTGQIDLAQVQLEVGETATPFEHRSFGDELARCQRYYYFSGFGGDIHPGDSDAAAAVDYEGRVMAVHIGSNRHTFFGNFPVFLRAIPTLTFYSPHDGASANAENYSGGGNVAISASYSRSRHGLNGYSQTSTSADTLTAYVEANAEL
tara:strand:- start:237 stop:1226 length:990 start_codon:yes stop_codon:yes gene_type:complete